MRSSKGMAMTGNTPPEPGWCTGAQDPHPPAPSPTRTHAHPGEGESFNFFLLKSLGGGAPLPVGWVGDGRGVGCEVGRGKAGRRWTLTEPCFFGRAVHISRRRS